MHTHLADKQHTSFSLSWKTNQKYNVNWVSILMLQSQILEGFMQHRDI